MHNVLTACWYLILKLLEKNIKTKKKTKLTWNYIYWSCKNYSSCVSFHPPHIFTIIESMITHEMEIEKKNQQNLAKKNMSAVSIRKYKYFSPIHITDMNDTSKIITWDKESHQIHMNRTTQNKTKSQLKFPYNISLFEFIKSMFVILALVKASAIVNIYLYIWYKDTLKIYWLFILFFFRANFN